MNQKELIAAGVNYLRVINNSLSGGRFMTAKDVAYELEVDEEHVKKAIRAAREHKELSNKAFDFVVATPKFFIQKDAFTGQRQGIEKVEIIFNNTISLPYEEGLISQREFLTPITLVITRRE